MLTASACKTTAQHHVNSLAAPPSIDVAYASPDTHYNMHYVDTLVDASVRTLSATDTVDETPLPYSAPEARLALSAAESGANCNIKDRFDRKAVLAYQWGNHTRSRLALDVDGIGFDGGDIEGVKLEYTFRLQKEKPRKMGCRYQSNWQGMVGSGYNEMFLRPEDQGAKADLRQLRQDIQTRWDTVWD